MLVKSKSRFDFVKNNPIQSGVTTMPINPEILALKIAPGTLPRAIDTITTDEETVDGTAAKNNTASQIWSKYSFVATILNGSTKAGNNTKVES